jgi:putative IMPACT (imprinted ancient) family translation regulator
MFYNTVSKFSKSIYKEQKSEFLSFIFPCSRKEDAEKILYEHKKKFNNARHICWALSLYENTFYDFSDNGEPGGTAGSCILNLVKSYSLFNILIIVIRYFGGTKLGVKNLTNAYRQAAINALENNEIIQEQPKIFEEIKILQEHSYKMLNFLKKYNIEFEMEEEENFYRFKVTIPEDKKDLFDENVKTIDLL